MTRLKDRLTYQQRVRRINRLLRRARQSHAWAINSFRCTACGKGMIDLFRAGVPPHCR